MSAWSVIAQFVVNVRFGFQSAEKLRNNLIVLASRRSGRSLGGSREMPNSPVFDLEAGTFNSKHNGVGPFDAYDFVDVEIDGTHQLGSPGITYQARVEVRVGRTGLTITPKVRNITDATDAGVGVACSASDPAYAGTNQRQTIALTIASGIKKYRLMYTLSGPGGDSWANGEIESFTNS
jgi:hypothetical protein